MKRQDKHQIRSLTLPQLRQKLAETEMALVEGRLRVAGGQEKNVRLTNKLRQQLAIIKTWIRDRELKEGKL